MIITVTMNPAIDRTLELEELHPGALNRLKRSELDAGGKGINVSRAIKALGGESLALGFLGGSAGRIIESVLTQQSIRHDFIWVEGETRTNTKVFEENGELTELNEAGPEIAEEKLSELLGKIESLAAPGALVVLAGSIPKGVEKDIYGKIIELVHGKGGKVLLDADGELFREALPYCPDIIKPNRAELEEYAGFDYRASTEELLRIARGLREGGIGRVVISMGSQGALFVGEEGIFQCPALSVKAHSTVGAGDAMVAAMAYAWERGMVEERSIRLCVASSAGAVTTRGTKPAEWTLVEQLMQQVCIEKIG